MEIYSHKNSESELQISQGFSLMFLIQTAIEHYLIDKLQLFVDRLATL